MFAACLEIYFKKVVSVGRSDMPVAERRFLGPGHGTEGSIAFVVALHRRDPVGETLLRLPGSVAGYRPIGFADSSVAKQLVHPRKSLGSARKHHQPGHRTVEPVHQSAEHIAGLGIFFLYICAHGLHQRRVAGFIALHDLAGRLVDHNYMVILVDHFHNVNFFTKVL